MERLQKVIAHAGVTSRRKAEKLIEEGRVTVNKETVRELGTKVSPQKDTIEVDGVPIDKEEPVYFLFYKPKQVISAVKDDKGRKVVTDFFEEVEERIFPVGRLDYDTSGLLLLTNDGEFANVMMHPKSKVLKTYIAKVKGKPSKETLQKLQRGIHIDGKKTAPAQVRVKSANKKADASIIEIVIHEGRNQQVRKMFEAAGHPVKKLKREKYGYLTLGHLKPGEKRVLKPFEVKKLKESAVT
ncbi:ribosomal large subunit pseudouridine synthase B [Alteribacillus persepolensis]|uniref:Pseudouridine synthase n=1 Tax=Alteribacillus persepolensis TaxID=568899 RepID=A0A1G7ZLR8_9BACI|nr:pseudouridine synthase [Alteribacillus persepolensis]SDH09599.1 ribosomal large subunit pseudouridine synthase B [Alteribacillus persepolensis]